MRESVRRVGQRFMIGFDGLEASQDAKRLIREFGVGHVILFARNVANPEQVAGLNRELQETARDAGHDTPLLVGVDQEGGRVARMGPPWTVWPPLRALGRIGSDDLARRMGAALAAECASAKHFPGHGDTDLDSHLELPVVEQSRSRLQDVEIRPFRRAIAAKVATIMMAHVLYPELDPEYPASISRPIVDGILRRELKYDGVVLTDDLEMKAVADRWTPDTSAVLALQAGCDIVPVCNTHDAQVTAIEGAVRAAESGDVPFKAMDDSLRRIRTMKERYLLPYRDPDPREARRRAGSPEFMALAQEIAERGGEALRF